MAPGTATRYPGSADIDTNVVSLPLANFQ